MICPAKEPVIVLNTCSTHVPDNELSLNQKPRDSLTNVKCKKQIRKSHPFSRRNPIFYAVRDHRQKILQSYNVITRYPAELIMLKLQNYYLSAVTLFQAHFNVLKLPKTG